MNRSLTLRILALLTIFAGANVYSQKSTERYIPLGKSPGLSGKQTVMGTVTAVDARRGTLTCTDSTGTIIVKVDKNTKIWVDRSDQRLMNVTGSLEGCRAGHAVEVKFRKNDRQAAVAEWIKVRATEYR